MLYRYRLIFTLFKKDILLEFRQQYSFYGVLLYVASTIFVFYMAMGQPENMVWNGLFWMMQLFICVNAVAKTFLQEGQGQAVIFLFPLQSRAFHAGQDDIQCCTDVADERDQSSSVYSFTGITVIPSFILFLGISCFGACSISLVFSFLAAIAARAQQNAALMAILGFPLIIPQLMLLMRLSSLAFSDVFQSGLYSIVLLLGMF